ncbi:F0F1 ATP synthase subunit delta, partial [[Clostridium] symbiosum]
LRRQDGILRAELTCVTPPSEEQLQGMKKYLCRRYRKNDVTFDIREDASLLGGFILKAGDFEYDYSLDGRLKRLQHKLTRR